MSVTTPVNPKTRWARIKRGWTVDRASTEPARSKVDHDELVDCILSGKSLREIVKELGCHPDSIIRASVRIYGKRARHNFCVGRRAIMASRNDSRA